MYHAHKLATSLACKCIALFGSPVIRGPALPPCTVSHQVHLKGGVSLCPLRWQAQMTKAKTTTTCRGKLAHHVQKCTVPIEQPLSRHAGQVGYSCHLVSHRRCLQERLLWPLQQSCKTATAVQSLSHANMWLTHQTLLFRAVSTACPAIRGRSASPPPRLPSGVAVGGGLTTLGHLTRGALKAKQLRTIK